MVKRILFVLAVCAAASAQDWPRFRGPNGSGVSEARGLPVEFSPSRNVLWKAELPPGHSSPILVGDRIFVTGFSPDRLYTICLDRRTGREVWRRELPRSKPAGYHANNSPASPTPASDGRGVYVFFQEAGLVAYDLEGRLSWELKLNLPRTSHGMGSSPIVAGDLVIVNCDLSSGASFLIAVEKESGRVRWRTSRAETGFITGFATPVVFGEDQIVVPGSLQWAAYSLRTGEKVWHVDGMPSQPKGSAIVTGDLVFGSVPAFADGASDDTFSFARALALDRNHDRMISREEAASPPARDWFVWADENRDGLVTEDEWNARVAALRGSNSLFALKPGNDPVNAKVLWKREFAVPYVTTPIHYGGILYLIKEGGILASIDPHSGEVLKRGRLDGALDQYFASPVAADGKLYLASQAGHVVVVKAGAQWEVLGVNDMEDDCYATPALGQGRLYVRTRSALYCFGEAQRGRPE